MLLFFRGALLPRSARTVTSEARPYNRAGRSWSPTPKTHLGTSHPPSKDSFPSPPSLASLGLPNRRPLPYPTPIGSRFKSGQKLKLAQQLPRRPAGRSPCVAAAILKPEARAWEGRIQGATIAVGGEGDEAVGRRWLRRRQVSSSRVDVWFSNYFNCFATLNK